MELYCSTILFYAKSRHSYMYQYSYFTVTFIIRLYLIFISLHNIVCKHQLPVVFKLLMKHIQIIELTE